MKKLLIFLLSMTFIINLTACNDSQKTIQKETETKLESVQLERDEYKLKLDSAEQKLKITEDEIAKLKEEKSELEKSLENSKNSNIPTNLVCTSNLVLGLIKDKNYSELANYVGPNGIRFTPYTYVNLETDIVITKQSLSDGTFINDVKTWGSYDGSGDPITLNFGDYYDKFIYNQDFINAPLIGVNNFIGTGNTINNISSSYPNGEYVEYHFQGFDPQYEGMDWESLIFVFEKINEEYKLVGVVHNHWTI